MHGCADEAAFFSNLLLHAGENILAGFHFAAQPVIFSEVLVVCARSAVHQQGFFAGCRKNIAQGSNDWPVHIVFKVCGMMTARILARGGLYLALRCLLGLAPVALLSTPAAAEQFPLYSGIRPNVAFWENIYSRYTTRQAVLHDSHDLSLVYGVVELVDPDLPLGTRFNEQRIKAAKMRLALLFDRLAAGQGPRTETERRIARMFAGRPLSSYRQAKERLRMQTGQKDRFYAGLVRSGRYLPYIRKVLAAEHLSLELAYLPHVESSFNPKAGSKAGAYGLWQFTQGTDRRAEPRWRTKYL